MFRSLSSQIAFLLPLLALLLFASPCCPLLYPLPCYFNQSPFQTMRALKTHDLAQEHHIALYLRLVSLADFAVLIDQVTHFILL